MNLTNLHGAKLVTVNLEVWIKKLEIRIVLMRMN